MSFVTLDERSKAWWSIEFTNMTFFHEIRIFLPFFLLEEDVPDMAGALVVLDDRQIGQVNPDLNPYQIPGRHFGWRLVIWKETPFNLPEVEINGDYIGELDHLGDYIGELDHLVSESETLI